MGFEYKTVGFVWDKGVHNPVSTPFRTVSYALFSNEEKYLALGVPET